jgi:hypothetical protein
MNEAKSFDTAAAHRFFSVDCFNDAWTLIDKPDRSAEDNQRMLALSFASLWHWTQRQDCAERNLSIAYWQLSRVFALLGDAGNATRYGEMCLQHSVSEPPFFLAYAHEALARAAALRNDASRTSHHLSKARKLVLLIDDPDDRALLEKDLQSLGGG